MQKDDSEQRKHEKIIDFIRTSGCMKPATSKPAQAATTVGEK
jgi:hypothetical protein